MSAFLKWLRSLGPIGGFIADAISLLTANWGAVMTVILGIVTSLWGWAVRLITQPNFQAGITVFLATFWTYIGFSVLVAKRKPRATRLVYPYDYTLAFVGTTVGMKVDALRAVQIGIQFVNTGHEPLKYEVSEMRTVLGGRTISAAEFKQNVRSRWSVIARGVMRVFYHPTIEIDAAIPAAAELKGSVEYTVKYGHPDKQFVRELKMALELTVVLRGEAIGIHNIILEEKDGPIKP